MQVAEGDIKLRVDDGERLAIQLRRPISTSTISVGEVPATRPTTDDVGLDKDVILIYR